MLLTQTLILYIKIRALLHTLRALYHKSQGFILKKYHDNANVLPSYGSFAYIRQKGSEFLQNKCLGLMVKHTQCITLTIS